MLTFFTALAIPQVLLDLVIDRDQNDELPDITQNAYPEIFSETSPTSGPDILASAPPLQANATREVQIPNQLDALHQTTSSTAVRCPSLCQSKLA